MKVLVWCGTPRIVQLGAVHAVGGLGPLERFSKDTALTLAPYED